MGLVPALNTYVDGLPLTAAQLNTDLTTRIRNTINASCVFVDVATTVSVSHAWNATQNFTPLSGVAINVTTGGIAVAGTSALGVVTCGALTASGVLTGTGLTISGSSGVQALTCTDLVASSSALLATLTVSSGGIAVTGDSTVTGKLTITGDVIAGGRNLTTGATAGFLVLPVTGNTPGVPAAGPGACYYDAAIHKFWIYDGIAATWRGVVVS